MNGDSAKFAYATLNCLIEISMNFGAMGENGAPGS